VRVVRRKSSALLIRALRGSTSDQLKIRQTARRDPCGGARREWRGRPSYAYGGGSHGCGYDAGCWAGTCACSRKNSRRSVTDVWVNQAEPSVPSGPVDAQLNAADSDLLTVRGAPHRVKPDKTAPKGMKPGTVYSTRWGGRMNLWIRLLSPREVG
jgi:hypothetical protein